MPDDRITLRLKGTVPIEVLATAISGFSNLVRALTDELASGTKIEWVVEELSGGSAEATLVGLSSDMASVQRVVKGYDEVGASVQEGKPIPFSPRVKRSAEKIIRVLNGKVSAVTFETMDNPYTVTSEKSPSASERQLTTALGTVEGIIHTLAGKESGIRFTLYDSLFDRAVSCYFSADPKERQRQEELIRPLWERRAIVQGVVTRDCLTDRPIEIRQISEVLPVIGGDFRVARGALANVGRAEPAEDTIRRARDA
jgi:hypothetical protein